MFATQPTTRSFAERRGFEPLIRFRRIRAFQARLFNHSSITPCVWLTECKGSDYFDISVFLLFVFRRVGCMNVAMFIKCNALLSGIIC